MLRITGYIAAGVLSLSIVTTLIVMSWRKARPPQSTPPLRLQWHMVTKNKIAKGTQIKADDVTWTLARVPKGTPVIPLSKPVVGKYALLDIEPGSTCVPSALSDLAPAEPPRAGVVVPIRVNTSDVSSLKPGMHLAFAQEKNGIQPSTTLLHKKNGPGLVLLSMTPSAKDAGETTLLVEITRNDLQSVPLLANGTWRPVILGASEPFPEPPPKPVKRCPPAKSLISKKASHKVRQPSR